MPNYGGGRYSGITTYGPRGNVYAPQVQNPQQIAGMPQFTEDYFIYSLNVGSVASLATVNASLTIQADSDFDWVMATVAGNLHGNSEPWTDATIIPITVLVTDGGSGRVLMSSGVPLTSLAGTGKQPFINPVVRRFKAKSTVNFGFTSYDPTTAWDNLFFNLIGRKIFELG